MRAIIFVIILGLFDAMIKGTIMSRKKWEEVPSFFKNDNLYPWILFFVMGIAGVMYSFAFTDLWEIRLTFYIQSLVLGMLGFESLAYWWSLKPLNIKQKAHWKPGPPPVTYFDYPDYAPWLDGLYLPLLISRLSDGENTANTTRHGVYWGSIFGILIAYVFDLIIHFFV